MTTSRLVILAIFPVLIGAVCGQSRSGPAAPTLAVEFDVPYIEASPPKHINLMEGGESTSEIPLDLLRPRAGATPSSTHGTLSLNFKARADKVITTVYIIPPESDPQRDSEGHKRLLGTHSAVLDETVTLNELKNIGYVPFAIRIVKANPPQTAHPALISKVPSIQLAITEHGTPNKDSRPLLFTFRHASKMTPQGMVTLPASPQQIVLEAALFSDGSAEGEPKAAARLSARGIENLAFYRVIIPVMDRIAGDSSLNDDTRVIRIKEEFFRVARGPDEAPLHSLETNFPDVPAADLAGPS